jgi:uncharacterized membrane protein
MSGPRALAVGLLLAASAARAEALPAQDTTPAPPQPAPPEPAPAPAPHPPAEPAVEESQPPAWFRGVGDFPGGPQHSEVLDLSSDGAIVLGRSATEDVLDEGFHYRVEGGALVPLLGPDGRHLSSEPRGQTPDLQLVVGKLASTRGPCEAARWTAAEGWTGLGDLEGGIFASQAIDVSRDGRVIVGWGSSAEGLVATRWVQGALLELGDLPGGEHHAAAALVSHDGLVIVGTGSSERGTEVWLWREETGMVALGDLPGGAFNSEPFGMTPDGAVIVGESTSERGTEAFRWSSATGMQGLGDLPDGTFESLAFGVSEDGARVVGAAQDGDGPQSFLWDATHGMRTVAELLRAANVAGLDGWRLREATAISADGRTLAGNGTNPDGKPEGWVARL